MPRKSDKIAIDHYFLDRRVKLIPCKREMVHYWYQKGVSIRAIAKMFAVDKRLIQFELFPERKQKNLSDRQDIGGTKIYYDKEKHRETMKEHRNYKNKLFKNEII